MNRPRGVVAFHALLVSLSLACGIVLALVLGADTMWDMKNYHLYNAYAYLDERIDVDIAPAGFHSYISPFADLPFFYLLVTFGARTAHILLGLFYGLLLYLVFLLNRRIFAQPALAQALPRPVASLLLPLCATVIGVTGGAGFGQAITTTNEVQTAALVVAALLLILPRDDERLRTGRALAAGLLAGVAVGLKWTAGIYLVAAIVVLLPWRLRIAEVRALVAFGLAACAGIAVAYGAWGWTLFAKFRNPLFPFYNGLFQSPWSAPENFQDRKFLPDGVLDALIYPVYWAFEATNRSSELYVRDPRLLAFLVAAIVVLVVQLGFRRLGRSAGMVLLFALVAYAVWLWRFSILRYAIPIEVLSGTLVVMGVVLLARALPRRAVFVSLGAVLAAAALLVYTRPPDWGRVPFEDAYAVSMQTVPEGSLVLLVGAPIAYIVPFMPGRALRFAGVTAWTTAEGPFRQALLQALDASEGRAWAVVKRGSRAEPLIGGLGWSLVEPGCTPVVTAMDPTGIDLCPLRKTG